MKQSKRRTLETVGMYHNRKNRLCRIIFSFAALFTYLLFEGFRLFNIGPFEDYFSYGWRSGLFEFLIGMVPFALLIYFSFANTRFVGPNTRVYPIVLFGTMLVGGVVFCLWRGFYLDAMIDSVKYVFDGIGEYLFFILPMIKVITFMLFFMVKKHVLKIYSVVMTVGYVIAAYASITDSYGYINDYLIIGTCISYVLFNITLWFWDEFLTDKNAFGFIDAGATAFAEFIDSVLKFFTFEEPYDTGEDDKQETFNKRDDNVPEDTERNREEIKHIIFDGESATVEYGVPEADISYFYKKMIISAICDGENKVLEANEVIRTLADERFVDKRGEVFTSEAVKEALDVIYKYGESLCKEDGEYLGSWLLDFTEFVLKTADKPVFIAQAVSLALEFCSCGNFEWGVALSNFTEGDADNDLPF